ncbi:Tn3 family transposase [Bacillus sp. S2(2024)]|uniref:Tn3 family transposase n=1 Tax=Bacillus sp. S2(2024) TaxID=3162887 RepID=UPI003D21E8D8
MVIKIDELFTKPIDWKVIEDYYEDMLRVIISIRTERIHPSPSLINSVYIGIVPRRY